MNVLFFDQTHLKILLESVIHNPQTKRNKKSAIRYHKILHNNPILKNSRIAIPNILFKIIVNKLVERE